MSEKVDIQAINQMVKAAKRPFLQVAKHAQLGLEWEPESLFAMQILAANPYLATAVPRSIRDAVVNVASVGLSLNPALQHAALVPRFRKGVGLLCCLDPMYRGLIHLALEGGNVVSVRADVVHKFDMDNGNFKYTSGTNPSIFHNPNPFLSAADRGEIVGAYVVAEIKDSKHPHITVVSKERLDQIRGMSETWKKFASGPWKDHAEEMAKKTVIKMGSKTWGTGNIRIQNAIDLANVAEGYDQDALEGEVSVVVSITSGQAKHIRDVASRMKVPVEKIYSVYEIKLIEELPASKYDECMTRIRKAGATYALRHASPGEAISPIEYGMTIQEMVYLASEVSSKASVVCEVERP